MKFIGFAIQGKIMVFVKTQLNEMDINGMDYYINNHTIFDGSKKARSNSMNKMFVFKNL